MLPSILRGKGLSRKRSWAYLLALSITGAFALLLLVAEKYRILPVTTLLALPIIVSAYFGGWGPGVLSLGFGIFLARVLKLGVALVAQRPLWEDLAERWSSLITVGLAVCVLIELLHRALSKVETVELLRSVTLSSIGEAVVTTDTRGRITFLNGVAAQLSGWSELEARGRGFTEVFDMRSELPRPMPDLTTEPIRVGTTVRLRGSFLRVRSGAVVPIEASAAPIKLADGSLHGVVLTMRDRTEHHRIEAEMRERMALQERLAAIARMLPGALHTLRIYADGSAKLPYASSSFEEVYGIDPLTLANDAEPMRLRMHTDDWLRVNEEIKRCSEALQPLHIEYRVHHTRKGLIWIELHAMPTRDGDRSTLWHGVLFDITQRKHTEDQLHASELRLRAALDAGEMGIVQIHLDSGGIELDERARQLWGVSWERLRAAPLPTLLAALYEEDRARFETQFLEAIATPQGFREEFRVVHPDGSIHWIACRSRVERSPAGGAHSIMGLISDITFRRQAEEQRLRSQKLEALGVLAGGIAHDFNNLLLAITGNISLMKLDLAADHPAYASLREIDKASARATALVRQILTFSQPQGHSRELIELRPVLEEVVGLARAILPAGISLQAHFAEAAPVVADAGQIHQAVLNLITNAADAVHRSDGRIEISLEEVEVGKQTPASTDLSPGRYVRIAVSDNGNGIAPATLQRIFDPFFTTKPPGQGTGLGLAIVHGIMKAHGGGIVVHSAPGEGATFALYFPVSSGWKKTAVSPMQSLAVHRNASILYVDDEEPLVFLMKRILEREGHQVAGFSDPRAALAAFQEHPEAFDLVVTDMTMPGLNGFELARAVLEQRPSMPVVITSGYLRPDDYEAARAIGVKELILKPNTVDELGEAIGRLLG